MTAPKSWYQLSMLQLLVAMAVTAVLVWLNRPVPHYLHVEIGGMISMGESQGWPIYFRPFMWREIPVILTPSAAAQVAIASPARSFVLEIEWLPLLADITFGAMLITMAVIIVGRFGKQKVPCPSPSTLSHPPSRQPITAPQRWYQLSMLHMLVAMAVVAVSIYLNFRVDRRYIPGIPQANKWQIEIGKSPRQVLGAGWPFQFKRAELYVVRGEEQRDDWRTLNAAAPNVEWVPLVSNCAVCISLIALVVLVSHKLRT